MEIWEPIQKTIDYIEQYIEKEFEINKLASIAYLSSFYYQRLFKRLAGKSVMEYIKLRKLAYAADCIARTKNTISNIAAQFGFKNYETFSRAFKEEYGISPSIYRDKKPTLIHFQVPDLSVTWSMKGLNVPLIVDGVVFEVERQVLSQPRYFDLSKSNNPAVYKADAEMEAPDITGSAYEPEGFIGWRLSIGSYIVCKIETESEELIHEVINKVTTFILSKWAEENQLILDNTDVKQIYHRYKNESLVIEIYYKIFDYKYNHSEKYENMNGGTLMFEEKMSIELITTTEEIKVTGLNFEKAGMEAKLDNFGKMWDNFSDECKNSIPNIKRPIVQYGIAYPENDYIVGREVTEYDDLNGKYTHYTLPAGKYLKISFNACSFDKLVCERIFDAIELSRYWINKNNLQLGMFQAEVYPSELTEKQYPEMYLLYLIKG